MIENWYNQDLNSAVKVQYLNGNVFSMDNNGNKIGVNVFLDGEPVTLTGSISANVIRADGGTISVSGTASDNQAYVVLPQACYAIPGVISIVIKNTVGSDVTTLCAVVANVYQSSTDTVVDPGTIIPSVQALISDIETAVASIPADYSSLWTSLAPAFSSSTSYAAGQYVTYNGALYRFTTAHSGSWAAADVTAVNIGADLSALKSAVDLIENEKTGITISSYPSISCIVSATNTMTRSSTKYKSYQIPRDEQWDAIEVTGNATRENGTHVTFVKEALPTTPTSGTDMSSSLCTGETGRHLVGKSESVKLHIPSDCAYIVIAYVINGEDATPSAVNVFTKIGSDVVDLQTALNNKLDKTVPLSVDWAAIFATASYPLGWQTGYYSKINGATGTSNSYMRSNKGKQLVAKTGEQTITFTVPVGYRAQISEFDSSGTWVQNFGNYDNGSNTVSATLTEGYRYTFSIGGFDNDADENLTSAFIATISAVIEKTFIAWQNEQDAKITELENSTNDEIPAYYFADGYLQGKLDEISRIQNEIGVDTEQGTINPLTDAFWFITDFHHRTNEGNSIPLLKYLSKRTGIRKLFFGGDAGGSQGTSQAAVFHQIQASALAWDDMRSTVDEFYGVLGNHEWINSTYGKISGMMGAYLNRYKTTVVMDAETGNYYVDNKANKIRYFFIQDTSSAAPISGTLNWLHDRLFELEDGWNVAVIMHYAWISPSYQESEYDGYSFEYNYIAIWGVSALLKGCRTNEDVVINGVTYPFATKTAINHIVGIFSGHTHHGIIFPIDNQYNTPGVLTFGGSTDCMDGGVAGMTYEGTAHGRPWYWENGIVDGTKVPREEGTVTEQCFYAVQLDLYNKKVYITAIGGDHDYEEPYES